MLVAIRHQARAPLQDGHLVGHGCSRQSGGVPHPALSRADIEHDHFPLAHLHSLSEPE